MADKLIIKEPVFIEADGRRIAVILPIEAYESLRARADSSQAQATSAETLSDFEREKAAFERLKPDLLARHPGKYVAIVGEQAVEVGDDKMQVVERVRQRFGRVSMYVQQVTDQPRVYHFPHRKVIRP
jgi:hypothetical protein